MKYIYFMGVLTSCLIMLIGLNVLGSYVDTTSRSWAQFIIGVSHVAVICQLWIRQDYQDKTGRAGNCKIHAFEKSWIDGKPKCKFCGISRDDALDRMN